MRQLRGSIQPFVPSSKLPFERRLGPVTDQKRVGWTTLWARSFGEGPRNSIWALATLLKQSKRAQKKHAIFIRKFMATACLLNNQASPQRLYECVGASLDCA